MGGGGQSSRPRGFRRPYRGRWWLLWMRVKYLPYRPVQRLLHRLNLHYMPPSYPDGDTVLWCHWCGARYVSERKLVNQEFPLR